ncbi:MAG: EAL domain-containing protein [Vallitalea sp.]|jgi:diguanylate cyclase (GGDEF)-like protein/PAS domain S-box-containing protein|nr:EAL domain-containing protein [Vallitalea sp.]
MEISNNFYYALINNIFSGYAYHKIITDSRGKPVDYEYLEINDTYCELTGLKREDIIGKRVSEVMPNIFKENFNWIEFFGEIAFDGSTGTTVQYFKPFNRWYQVNVFSVEKGTFVEIFTDITELKQHEIALEKKNEQLRLQNEELAQIYEEIAASEEELRQQNERISKLYEELVASKEALSVQNSLLQQSNETIKEQEHIYKMISEASNDGIWYWYFNDKVCVLSLDWYKELDICLDTFFDINRWYKLLHPDDRDEARKKLEDCIAGKVEKFESNYRVCTSGGTYKWLNSKAKIMFGEDGKPILMVGADTDITYRKKREEKIKNLAYYDSLTKLPNRVHLLEKINESIKSNDEIVGIIFMDIDNFKSINDNLGFTVGDDILKQVGKRLSKVIDKDDFIARLSGDEFAAILRDLKDNEDIVGRVNKIKKCFDKPFNIDNNRYQLSVSIGISVYPYDGVDSKELIKNADTAMYKVKKMGKNNISFFTQNMKEEFLRKFNIEKQLKSALENNEFKLVYQPQFEVKTGKIRGFEVLLRWFNPSLGYVSPMLFIPIAEEIGIINEIGEWVLKEACIQYKKWNTEYSYRGIISVNISPIQLKTGNFYNTVSNILEEIGIESGCLELEITENLFIDALESAKLLLNKLIELGVRISLDDFGTGYSSLSYLKSLPIDTLKIDKSFIKNTTHEGVEREITSSVIELVRKIGLETIAEGVENDKQFNFLYESMCDNIQGFLTGKPVDNEQVIDIIKKGNSDFSKYIDEKNNLEK